jgi:hypothetical protein
MRRAPVETLSVTTAHPGAEQFDVGARRLQPGNAVVTSPLEQAAKVMAVRLQRSPVVAGEE